MHLSVIILSVSSVKRGSKELWQTVRELTGKNKQADKQFPVDAGTLNKHYATISTNQNYSPPLPKLTVNKFTEFLTEQSVFQLLDTAGHTATGLDKIPSWFLRIAAPLISEQTAYIFNLSLSYSVVPTQWKSSSITPVPKVPQPKTCQDFRPISVTPVLSQLMEKEFIKLVIYPVFDHPQFKHRFSDQFAFRPTGSTTAALIHLVHTLTDLLANRTLCARDRFRVF